MGKPLDPREVMRHGGIPPRGRDPRASRPAGDPRNVAGKPPLRTGGGPHGMWHDAKIRSILRANGYHVSAGGGYNPKVHSAWMDYLLHTDHGRAPSGAKVGSAGWNAANARTAPAKPASPKQVAHAQNQRSLPAGVKPGSAGGIGKPKGKVVGGGRVGGGGKVGGSKGAAQNSAMKAVSTSIGKPISEKLAGQSNVKATADQMAGAQYDPQIHQLETQAAQNPRQAAQDQADISSWMNQVLGAEGTAGTQDKAAYDQASSATEAATKAIMASLGDSAGNYNIAQQGAQNVGAINAINLADQQYHNNMNPLLQQQAADAKKVDQVRMGNALQDVQNKLLEARGARGQLEASDLNTLNQQAIDRLLQIKQYNNSLSQQNYSNQLSAQEAAVAAAMTGAQINSLNASTKATKATANGFIPWMKLRPDQQAALIDQAMKPYIGSNGELTANPLAVRNATMQYLRGLNYSSARKMGVKAPNVNGRAQAGINNMVNARLSAAQAAAAHQAKLNA